MKHVKSHGPKTGRKMQKNPGRKKGTSKTVTTHGREPSGPKTKGKRGKR